MIDNVACRDCGSVLASPPSASAIDVALRIVDRLVERYRADPVEVAAVCDERLDRSGNLLGWLRLAAKLREDPR